MPSARPSIEDSYQRLISSGLKEEDWPDFFEATWPFVVGRIRVRISGNPELVEELAQEVLVRLAATMRRTGVPVTEDCSAIRRVIGGYSRIVCIEHVRKASRTVNLDLQEILLAETATELADECEAILVLEDAIERICSSLSEESARILKMLLDGAQTASIAEALGTTKVTARVKVCRLRHTVRQELRRIYKDVGSL